MQHVKQANMDDQHGCPEVWLRRHLGSAEAISAILHGME